MRESGEAEGGKHSRICIVGDDLHVFVFAVLIFAVNEEDVLLLEERMNGVVEVVLRCERRNVTMASL